ncbi:AMP-binding protein, partial [Mycobacteriaceae bacterium Msp059]|nr:AMP-binding protein [Mycobacteriaceae bacterium Msp059]
IDPAVPDARVEFMLADAGPVAVLTTVELVGRLGGCGVPVVAFDDGRIDAQPSTPLPFPAPDDLAHIIYTSGTTGRPKGVAITHANVVRLLDTLDAELGLAGQTATP